MELCKRCKINKVDIKYSKAREKYCKLCDYFVHNIMNNNNNKADNNNNKNNNKILSQREKKEKYIKKKNQEDLMNKEGINNNNECEEELGGKNNYYFEYENLYQRESQNFLNKINQLVIGQNKYSDYLYLNTNIKYSENNLNKDKDLYLNNNFENLNSNLIKGKNEESNTKNLQKNNDIKSLQKIIEEQREKIIELKLNQNNLKNILIKKDLLIKKLNNDIDEINNKNLSIEENFNKQISIIKNEYNIEKEKIIKNYEEIISKLKISNNNSKDKNEFDNLKLIINKLEKEIKNINEEKMKIIQEKENLKKENDKIKNELKLNIDENEILKEIIGNNLKNKETTNMSKKKYLIKFNKK